VQQHAAHDIKAGMSYDSDFYLWTKFQAEALRRRATNEIDWENIAGELETLGKNERQEIGSRLKILLIHLLKWKYQPDRQCDNWHSSVVQARAQVNDLVTGSPFLRGLPVEYLAEAYRQAIADKAIRRLDLLHLPTICPWTIDQVLNAEFLS
jgi:hypothetical protein